MCKDQKREKISIKSKEGIYTNTGRDGYFLHQKGLLLYKGRVVVPAQKALTQELLYLYHDDQLAGHWGVQKTKELLELLNKVGYDPL